MPRHARFSLKLACAAGLLCTAALSLPAAAQTAEDFMKMNQAASDTASAASIIPSLRKMIVSASDSVYAGAARQLLLRALVNSHAAPRAIAAAADSTVPYIGTKADRRAAFFASVAQALAERNAELPKALIYARRAFKELPSPQEDPSGLRAYVIQNLGFVHMKSGHADSAITYLNQALPMTPDSQEVLINLGAAYEKKGDLDAAINSYVRSLAVFPGRDTTGSGQLRAAYLRRYNTLQGLDARLDNARKRSRENVALEPRRHEAPAPVWTLNDLDGHPVDSSSLVGKVVVIDFWGSWCGPCRRELPLFEALYQQHRNNDKVVFMSVNWERDREHHAQLAREYVKNNNLNFPVVIDPDQKAVTQYGIQGFPTVFVIDAKGQIRYQNIGVADNIEDILEAQVQSLLE